MDTNTGIFYCNCNKPRVKWRAETDSEELCPVCGERGKEMSEEEFVDDHSLVAHPPQFWSTIHADPEGWGYVKPGPDLEFHVVIPRQDFYHIRSKVWTAHSAEDSPEWVLRELLVMAAGRSEKEFNEPIIVAEVNPLTE